MLGIEMLGMEMDGMEMLGIPRENDGALGMEMDGMFMSGIEMVGMFMSGIEMLGMFMSGRLMSGIFGMFMAGKLMFGILGMLGNLTLTGEDGIMPVTSSIVDWRSTETEADRATAIRAATKATANISLFILDCFWSSKLTFCCYN